MCSSAALQPVHHQNPTFSLTLWVPLAYLSFKCFLSNNMGAVATKPVAACRASTRSWQSSSSASFGIVKMKVHRFSEDLEFSTGFLAIRLKGPGTRSHTCVHCATDKSLHPWCIKMPGRCSNPYIFAAPSWTWRLRLWLSACVPLSSPLPKVIIPTKNKLHRFGIQTMVYFIVGIRLFFSYYFSY